MVWQADRLRGYGTVLYAFICKFVACVGVLLVPLLVDRLGAYANHDSVVCASIVTGRDAPTSLGRLKRGVRPVPRVHNTVAIRYNR